MTQPIPASETKHLNQLNHPLIYPFENERKKKKKKKILELGSGIGYSSLNLLSKGFKLISTDIQPILNDVLKPNLIEGIKILNENEIKINIEEDLKFIELNWIKISNLYDNYIFEKNNLNNLIEIENFKKEFEFEYFKEINFIILSDTFYTIELIKPLWKTLILISIFSSNTSKNKKSNLPIIYISLERRDSILIDKALDEGKNLGFNLKQIHKLTLKKEIEKYWNNWKDEDWDDIEIWKCRWKGK
ncbi:uncharacterized protein I206_101794 [Kwoniella pini CBS 10737]|uniref:Methyltransferase domain-containing protein n=1 Tax=Kwoniella pini CBS 10737 TaxID=1296096 RepID=A0AAJ8L2F2_9TREE